MGLVVLCCSLGVGSASKNTEVWWLGMWFSDGLGSAELMVGLDDLGGAFPALGFSHCLVAVWGRQQDRDKLGHLKLGASSLWPLWSH